MATAGTRRLPTAAAERRWCRRGCHIRQALQARLTERSEFGVGSVELALLLGNGGLIGLVLDIGGLRRAVRRDEPAANSASKANTRCDYRWRHGFFH
jgi:hypothetical protein